MSPTWYDLLGVGRDASDEEVRAAWKAGIADLEPGDRRFDALNRAAKVLLDPQARAAYDASLESEATEGAGPEATGGAGPEATEGAGPEATEGAGPEATEGAGPEPGRTSRFPLPRSVPTWLLSVLGVLALVLVPVTAWLWLATGDDVEEGAREAQVAAERAAVPVLSYDHRSLEDDQAEAQGHLTARYREDYDKLFAVIVENAPETQTTVTAEVVSSGIVRAAEDRVQVLLFVDRPTTNKLSAEPTVYKDQVTLTMQKVDEEWLVDDMTTSPVQQ